MPSTPAPSTVLAHLTEPTAFVPCNVCGADAARPLFRVGQFQVVECERCGLAYTNPRLTADALREVYGGPYFESPDSLVHGYEDYVAEKPNIQRTFRQRWRQITKLAGRPGRLLEIGCAHGFLLEIAERDGWTATGLDTSADAVAYARDVLHLDAQLSDVSTIPFRDGSFDAIVMWDVVEHLTDPAATLALCARKLSEGGVLSIITPDRSSILARVTGRSWVEYQKPHEHLYFFSRRLLRQLLERAGLHVVRTGTAGKYVPIGFAFERLAALSPVVFGPLVRIARATGIARAVVKINPRDKMHMLARKPLTT